MSIHVCSCMHHGVGEWHLRYPGMSQEAAQGIADKINSGMLDGKQADRIAALEAELARVTAERDEWVAKWKEMRRMFAEAKYPGMTNVVKVMDGDAARKEGA